MIVIRRMLSAALLLTAVTVSQAQSAPKSGTAAKQKPSATTQTTTTSEATAAKKSSDSAEKMDINTATVDQLKSLPGIGDAYAAKIVAGRPYTAKNQLTTKGVIPQGTYDKIKEQIVAHHPAAKK